MHDARKDEAPNIQIQMPTLLQKQTIYDTSMYLKLKKYLCY